jgi:hypothetical protein
MNVVQTYRMTRLAAILMCLAASFYNHRLPSAETRIPYDSYSDELEAT